MNAKVAEVETVTGSGCSSRAVSGAVVSAGGSSMVQVRVAGDASRLPAASMERTAKVCSPRERPVRARGEVHAAKAPPSTEHSKVRYGPGVALSYPVKENDAAVEVEGSLGLLVITVFGATSSGPGGAETTVQVCTSGVRSTLSDGSIARTSKVCSPLMRNW